MYKRQAFGMERRKPMGDGVITGHGTIDGRPVCVFSQDFTCLLYTSDAADERSSVDLGGRRIIKKKNQ